MLKVAVIFHRLGPYHFARLRAAGRHLSVVAIETSGADDTYAWDPISGSDGFERVTLFDRADAQKKPAAEVARQMSLALDKIRPAVVVVPGWGDAAALGALRWCIIHQVPSILMSESTAWDEPRKSWKEFIKRQIVTLGSAALAGGTPHRDYLAQLGLPAERVFLGYDAVDNRYFADQVAEVRSQKSEVSPPVSGLKSPVSGFSVSAVQCTPYFLASARFIEKKNLPRLIQAYARYRKLAQKSGEEKLEIGNQKSAMPSEAASDSQFGVGRVTPCAPFQPSTINHQPSTESPPSDFQVSGFSVSDFRPWSLVLLGDGELRSTLHSQVSGLGLHSSVLLPGFKQYPELPAYYAHAGAFIHASTTEQWGLVVNEAMASGLPVLVSNRCGCAHDLVQPGVNGFTFDPYNVEELAQLMLKLSTLPDSQLSTVAQASQRLIANWGPDRFASGLQAAAGCALKVGPIKPTLLQRLILKALLWK